MVNTTYHRAVAPSSARYARRMNGEEREPPEDDDTLDEQELPPSIDVQPEDPREPGRASPEPID